MSQIPDWQRLKDLVAQAQRLNAQERVAFLERACDDDTALLSEARALLGISPGTGFMDEPAVEDIDGGTLKAGTLLGAFRITRALGAGGMGDVYLAERHDGAYEETVAVKVIRLAGGPSELRDRFLSERRLMAELRHPNIAQLLDAGSLEDGRPYFVMEWVDGEPIDSHCRRRGLSVRQRVELMIQVAGAVAHAHRHLVVHRDLKPGNIFVAADGTPKLLDFGVAKDLSDVGKTPSTRLLVPMTPEYASPEQLTGGALTTATDVYSLGVVLYELLTGASPFGGADDPMSGRSQSSPPNRPSSRIVRGEAADRKKLKRQLAGDLDTLILKTLDPDPAKRYSSVEALQRDLWNYLQGRALEAQDGFVYRARKWARRHWKPALASVLALGLTVGWWLEREERRQAEELAAQRQEQSVNVADATRELGTYLVQMLSVAGRGAGGERNIAVENMINHAAALLDNESTFASEPLFRATFQGVVGTSMRRMGRARDAKPRLEECLKIRRERLPPEHSEIALAANNLGVTLRQLGELQEAHKLLTEAETIFLPLASERKFEKLLASVWSNLGGIERELGNLEISVRRFEQALAARQRLDPEDHDALAKAHKNLASGLIAAGRLDDAEYQLEQALQRFALEPIPKTEAGIEHYSGLLAQARGDLDGARAHFEKAYEIRTKVLDAEHRQTLETKRALASLDAG